MSQATRQSKTGKPSSALVPTLKLVQQVSGNRGIMSTLLVCIRATAILANLPGHMRLVRALEQPHMAALTASRPKLEYKYLNAYLARSFSRNIRLGMLTNHYRYLAEHVNETLLVQAFDERARLWEERRENCWLRIVLLYPYSHEYEGEFSLVFETDALPIYEVSFSIVPGHLIGTSAEQALLISCVQGAYGQNNLIRKVRKLCHDIPPSRLLLAAAQGFALALNIRMIAGVSIDQQLSSRSSNKEPVEIFDYDEFWESYRAKRTEDGLFHLPVPFAEKPIEQIKPHHRVQAMRRREFRLRITQHVQTLCRERFLRRAE